jgi:hypothetical protein
MLIKRDALPMIALQALYFFNTVMRVPLVPPLPPGPEGKPGWIPGTHPVRSSSGQSEVDAFYWTDWAPDIVNPRREEQGLVSL